MAGPLLLLLLCRFLLLAGLQLWRLLARLHQSLVHFHLLVVPPAVVAVVLIQLVLLLLLLLLLAGVQLHRWASLLLLMVLHCRAAQLSLLLFLWVPRPSVHALQQVRCVCALLVQDEQQPMRPPSQSAACRNQAHCLLWSGVHQFGQVHGDVLPPDHLAIRSRRTQAGPG